MNSKNKLLLLFLGIALNGTSQLDKKSTPKLIPTNQERYKIDFELKNYVFIDGDSSILNQLKISDYESFRLLDENKEIFIPTINQTLILYPLNNPNKEF